MFVAPSGTLMHPQLHPPPERIGGGAPRIGGAGATPSHVATPPSPAGVTTSPYTVSIPDDETSPSANVTGHATSTSLSVRFVATGNDSSLCSSDGTSAKRENAVSDSILYVSPTRSGSLFVSPGTAIIP